MPNPTIVFPKARDVAIEDREIPKPGEGQILIRSTRTLISTGTELTIMSGEFPEGSDWAAYGKFPFTAGYSNAGEVVEVGEGVDEHWKGVHVTLPAHHAAYVVSRPGSVARVPETVEDKAACFSTLGIIVMNGIRQGYVTWGESIVIYGAGLIGQLAARFSLIAGARPVINVDVVESRQNLLPDGVHRVNPANEDPVEVVRRLTHDRMADAVYEATGNPAVLPEEFKVLRRQGRAVILSSPRGPSTFDFHDLCNAPSYTIIGAHNSSHPPEGVRELPWSMKRHTELFLDFLADGSLDVEPLVSHRVPYSEGPDAYRMLLEDRSNAMGVVINWDDAP
jgi:2-desacetyl-2-hydroxyethyl bacteriochlorophyllide A dehydrogenase